MQKNNPNPDRRALEEQGFDFKLYLEKSKMEPLPLPNSVIWVDDPFEHDEKYHKRRRLKAAQKKYKRRRRP